MSAASFSSLFQRGRYIRTELPENHDGENSEGKQQRVELFTVAAVAFTMKHNCGFKRHFLETICDVHDIENLDDYEILLQPYDFDLVLKNDVRSEVVVIEFKVDAPLYAKQNFENVEVFANSSEGYGFQISTKYPKTNLKYVILLQKKDREGFSEKSVCIGNRNIACFSRAWSNLMYVQSEPAIVKDLLDWLAQIIPEMKNRIYKDIENVQSTKAAAEMCGLLSCVAENRLESKKVQFKKPRFDGKMEDEEFWFGVIIPRDSKDFDGLRKLVNPTDDEALGWFGYAQHAGTQPRLEVWIYTGAADGEALKRMASLITNQLGEIACVASDHINNTVILSCNVPEVHDVDWFDTVITRLQAVGRS
jgi:hypothetical protein